MRKINIIILLLAFTAILIETIRGNEPWEVQDQSKLNQIGKKHTADTLSNLISIIHFEKAENNFPSNNGS